MNIPGIEIKRKLDGAHNREEQATADTRPLRHGFFTDRVILRGLFTWRWETPG